MRNRFFVLRLVTLTGLVLLISCQHSGQKKHVPGNYNADSSVAVSVSPNTLSDQEKNEGWVLLFDGQTSNGWRGYGMDTFPETGWKIENGTIHCLKKDEHSKVQLPDIITIGQYKNFEFSVDWMISDHASSGIFLYVLKKPKIPIWESAIKMQIADNIENFYTRWGSDAYYGNGSLYGILPANVHLKSRVGIWNQTRIVLYHGHVEFIINGERVLEFQLWTKNWEEIVRKSKFRGLASIINPGGPDRDGHIGLQNNGTEVWFRNIKIRVAE